MIRSSISHAARATNFARLALTAAVAITGALTVTGNAQAEPTKAQPVTITFPAGVRCAFEVTMTTVDNSAQTPKNPKLLPPEGLGPTGQNFTGNFVVTFANPANGKSQTFNVSGATHVSTNGNIETETHTGPYFLLLGPKSRAATGLPGIVVGTGRAVVVGDTSTRVIQSFSSTVPVTDVCALLA